MLQGAFFALILAEALLPSLGLLTILAMAMLGGSWYMLMDLPVGMRWIFFAIDITLVPLSIVYSFKFLKKSPISLSTSLEKGSGKDIDRGFLGLVGKEGKVIAQLRPLGKADIEGSIYEVTLENGLLDAGDPIIVLEVKGEKIIVQKK